MKQGLTKTQVETMRKRYEEQRRRELNNQSYDISDTDYMLLFGYYYLTDSSDSYSAPDCRSDYNDYITSSDSSSCSSSYDTSDSYSSSSYDSSSSYSSDY